MDAYQGASVIATREQLRDVVGIPKPRAVAKERHRLEQVHQDWLAASPFCLVATADADGACDVSPKGDPPGFALVLDDTTLAIPERPGNRRADGYENVLANPHVGLVFVVPGRTTPCASTAVPRSWPTRRSSSGWSSRVTGPFSPWSCTSS